MKKFKHVYCTECVYGKKWIQEMANPVIKPIALIVPRICQTCYPFNPEDSTGNDMRVNYKESLLLKIKHILIR